MANNKEISIEMIAKIAMLAAKTAVDEILERKPVYTSAEKVNNSLHNSETFIRKMKDRCKSNIVRDRHNILMEKEDNETVKSLQFCYLKSA